MLEHRGEGFEALASAVFVLEIVHADDGGLDAGETEPRVGFAVVAVDNFEADAFVGVFGEIEFDAFGFVIAWWVGTGEFAAGSGFDDAEEVFVVRFGGWEAAVAVEPEGEFGGCVEGFGLEGAGAAFFVSAAFGDALQDSDFGAVSEFSRLEGPLGVSGAGPRWRGFLGIGFEELFGEVLSLGEEFGRWRRAAFGEAVVEGGEEWERGGRD